MNRNESPEPKFEADDTSLKVILPSNSQYKAFRFINLCFALEVRTLNRLMLKMKSTSSLILSTSEFIIFL